MRIPIRLKLMAALAVPVLVLFVVTALEVIGTAKEVRGVQAQTDLAEAAIGPSGAITQLQNERRWSAVELVGGAAGSGDGLDSYEAVRAKTDQALADLQAEIGQKGGAISPAFEPAFEALAALDGVRTDVDHNTSPRTPEANLAFSQDTFDRYSAIITPLFDATTRVSFAVNDPELRRGAELADVAARQIETMSVLVMNLYVTAQLTEGGVNTRAEIADLAMLQAAFEDNAETMRTADGPFADIAAEHYPVDLTDQLLGVVDQAIATTRVDPVALSAALDQPGQGDYAQYQDAIADAIRRRADDLNSSARSRQRSFAILAALVLASATVLTWAVSRSISRPLRGLTRKANDMANRHLPDAVADILSTPLGEDVTVPQVSSVRIDSRDEVSDLVDALNTVQRSALDLAVEQAVLRRNIADSFVNLGRRNQNLLARQLGFITQLETNETESDVLANLFRLDHLATRMRRNAESLVVLAGIEPSQRWAPPVRVTDVVRAGLGEVEDYQRVAILDLEPATVHGSAAADLTHLMAELIENALVFSGPGRTVHIRGRYHLKPMSTPPGGLSGEHAYVLAVVDDGPGMTAEDLTAANRRLAGDESFTVAPSRYLGHYVAGQLAARHNISVHLDSYVGGGLVANVWLPPRLLTADPRPNGTALSARAGSARPTPDPPSQRLWPDPRPEAPSDGDLAAHASSGTSHARIIGDSARQIPEAPIFDTQATAPRLSARRPAYSASQPARSAQEAHGFLANFTAGVQRGFDRARRDHHGRPHRGSRDR